MAVRQLKLRRRPLSMPREASLVPRLTNSCALPGCARPPRPRGAGWQCRCCRIHWPHKSTHERDSPLKSVSSCICSCPEGASSDFNPKKLVFIKQIFIER